MTKKPGPTDEQKQRKHERAADERVQKPARRPEPDRPGPTHSQPAPGDPLDEVVEGEGDRGLDGFK